MTKTITELQPMIYGDLFARTWERKRKQRKLTTIVRKALWPAHVATGLMIVFDAGAAPWDVRFWLMFLPFFFLGEAVFATLVNRDRTGPIGVSATSRSTNWFAQFESTSSVCNGSRAKLVDPIVARLENSKQMSQRADVLVTAAFGA